MEGGEEGCFFSTQGELHGKNYKDIKQHGMFDHIEHSKRVAKDEGDEGEVTGSPVLVTGVWIVCGTGSH